MGSEATLRVKVPCADEGEFYARLADKIAENGLRLPTDAPPAIGARARVALEFRDGGVLAGDAVVEERVQLDGRPGVKVRFLELDRPDGAPAAPAAPAAQMSGAAGGLPPRAPTGAGLEDALFGEVPPPDPGTGALAFTGSTEIAAAVARRTGRFQRLALVAAALALAVALAGFGIHRWSGSTTPAAAAAAHLQAADQLLKVGKLTGRDGALDHLLAAKRLRPDDAATARRLERLADLLERLAAGALERGDLAVAAIHLGSARAAAPDRESLRAKQAELERRQRLAAARPDPHG
jgi:hypothetical protein